MKCGNCGFDTDSNEVYTEAGNRWQCPECSQWNSWVGSSVLSEEVCTALFTKHDYGKPRYGLIPPLAELEMVKVLTFGADKYSADNWRNCDDLNRYVDAALRHIALYRMGEYQDPESYSHHLAHAMCCLAFIVDIEIGNTEIKVQS